MLDNKDLVKNTVFNVLSKGVASGTSLLLGMFASRKIGVESFGAAQYIIWLVSTIWLFLNVGVPITLVRYISLYTGSGKRESANRLVISLFGVSLIVCLIGIMILIFVLNVPKFLWIESALLFGCVSFGSVFQSMCEGLMRYKLLLRASITGAVASGVVAYPLINADLLEGYVAVLIIGSLSSIVVLRFGLKDFSLFKRRIGDILQIQPDVRSFAFFAWLAVIISSFVWQRMELFFIGNYLTNVDVAFFSIAVLVSGYITQPIGLLSSALLPYFSKESVERGDSQLYATYFFLTKGMAWITFFVCFFLAIHSTVVIALVYGNAYEPASAVTAVVLAGSSFGTIAAVGSALLYGHGKAKFIAVFGSIGAIMAIVAGITIIPVYGVLGAGISKIIIQVIMVMIGTYYIVTHLRFRFPFSGCAKSFLLSAAICGGIRLFLATSTLAQFAMNAFIATLLYLAGTVFFSVFDADEARALKGVVTKILQ